MKPLCDKATLSSSSCTTYLFRKLVSNCSSKSFQQSDVALEMKSAWTLSMWRQESDSNWLHVKNTGAVTLGWVISVGQTLHKFILASHLRWEYYKYYGAEISQGWVSHPDPLNKEIPQCHIFVLVPSPRAFIERKHKLPKSKYGGP